jgi:tetratricopeptide (TPR) repeat protein
MIRSIKLSIMLFIMLLVPLTSASAAGLSEDIALLQHEWAQIKYQTSENLQEAQFEALAKTAETITARYPNRAEPLIWEGIILSTWAGSKGGLGALSLVKQSRDRLEAALVINPAALDGSAYTSLGTLYFKVPGWPIGFGDDEKAEEMLTKALGINPDGIDPNFFYGEFLLEEERYQESIRALNQALQAAPRPERKVADAGRKSEIQLLLAEAQKHIN